MPDREYGGGSYNSGYGRGGGSNPRAGDTPGFGTGGGGSVGGGGGFGMDRGGGIAGPGPSGWESQGRGSNVTSARPTSPVEQAAGVVPGGPVNAAGPSPAIPIGMGQFPMGPTVPGVPIFSTQAPMAPQTIGVPTINLGFAKPGPYSGAFVGQNVRNYMNPSMGIGTDFYGNTGQVSSGALRQTPQPAGFSKPLDAQVRQDYLSWLEKQSGLASGSLSKQHAMEVGSVANPDVAQSPTGALGPFQFTRGTAKSMGLINPLTGEDMRTDFIQSADAAAALNVKNAQGLSSFLGRQPTAAELSIAYQQGLGGAKALLGNPNLSAKEALTKAYRGNAEAAERAIRVNGGDPNAPASQFTGKLTSAFNSMPSDLSKLAAYRGSPADLPAISGKTAAQPVGGGDFAVPGGQQTAAQAASSSPQTFGEWLGSLFDTSGRVSQLEAQGRTSTYPEADVGYAKQKYAEDFAGGDVSKVKSRIVDFGQGPVVDYYVKDLGEAIFGGLGQGIASLFGGKSEGSSDANLSDEEYFRKYGRNRGE